MTLRAKVGAVTAVVLVVVLDVVVLDGALVVLVVAGFCRFFILLSTSVPVPSGRAEPDALSVTGKSNVRMATVAMVIRDRERRAMSRVSDHLPRPLNGASGLSRMFAHLDTMLEGETAVEMAATASRVAEDLELLAVATMSNRDVIDQAMKGLSLW